MRDDQTHAGGAPGGRDEIRDLATLMRAGADGELTAPEQARLDEHLRTHEDDGARVAFERQLRSACSRVMGGGACPPAVRAAVERIAAGSRVSDGADPIDDEAYGAAVEARGAETRDRSFWASPRVVPVLGAAAAIVMMFAVGGLLITQSGTGAGGPGSIGGATPSNNGYVQTVARFVANEHDRCWESEDAADRKFVMKDRDTVVTEFKDLLGGEMHIPALDQPVEAIAFRGGGHCRLPETSGAAHLRWDIPAHDDYPASAVSMFVTPDNGMLPLEEGVTYAVDTKACGAEGASLLVWKADGVVHYLIAETETGSCEKFRGAMGAPEKTEGL